MNTAADQIKFDVERTAAKNGRVLRKLSVAKKNSKVARVMMIARWGRVPKSDNNPKFWRRVRRSLFDLAKQKGVFKKPYLGDHPLLAAALAVRELPPFRRKESDGVASVVYADKYSQPLYCSVIDGKGATRSRVLTTLIGDPPPYALELHNVKTGHLFLGEKTPDGVKIELLKAALENLAAMSTKDIRVAFLGEPKYTPPPKKERTPPLPPPQQKIDFSAPAAATTPAETGGAFALMPPPAPSRAAAASQRNARPKQVRQRAVSNSQTALGL